jgi:hypothetical protein
MDHLAESASRGQPLPSELSNCDQTAHDGTVILTMDQRVEAVSGRSSGPHEQFSTILDQLASDKQRC